MQINRLRLIGFKSFVEPTELHIEQGLTGVVGPNGCGKSNLLEALRWVMGETSHKSMRAAAMDDVIFSGTTTRPARNGAEVTIFIDNAARSAPAAFNDSDIIEITRRIEREAGSTYRVNGREVRARDIKILFEDAATGARSPALVRQGQIGEIVNAKPEQRRRILEDAAGVAGLHSRRHEAELRLRAAEGNLARLADIMGQLDSQIEGLKRQARQARRYRELSIDIRRCEAVAMFMAWSEAQAGVEAEEASLRHALAAQAAATEAESAALRKEIDHTAALPPLRDAEASRTAAVARLKVEQTALEREAERAAERQRELEARIRQLAHDREREAEIAAEAAETLARLDDEIETLATSDDGAADAEAEANAALATARQAEEQAQRRQTDLTRRDFELRSRRKSLETSLAERRDAAGKASRQLLGLRQQIQSVAAAAPEATRLSEQQHSVALLAGTLEELANRLSEVEDQTAVVAAEADDAREAAGKASLDAHGVATEVATLSRLVQAAASGAYAPIVDSLTVEPGYEMALGAALGDDLEAPAGELDSAIRWRLLEPHASDPHLPEGAEPLATKVAAPPELARRLAQIGLVERDHGAALQPALAPGQRLVSREGDLWRWDGFIADADAPTAAAHRLALRNQLAALEERQSALTATAAAAVARQTAADAVRTRIEDEARRLRQEHRDHQSALVKAQAALSEIERRARETESRLATLREAEAQAGALSEEATERLAETEIALEGLAETEDLADDIAAAEAALTAARTETMASANRAAAMVRERELRTARLAAARAERQRWFDRSRSATEHIATLQTRLSEAHAELVTLAELPGQIADQRQRLLSALADADRERAAAADALARSESGLREAQQALKAAQSELGQARETRARIETWLEAQRNRRADEARRIRETFSVAPEDCLAAAGVAPGPNTPSFAEVDRQLQRLKSDRERLGGVNLQADDELTELNSRHESMTAERADIDEAIAKLRGAIGQLNREAKKRLNDAFQSVDQHFQKLFTVLFNGGEARLEMIEGEDPLEGGLEIIAKPPGKKPATLSLLSGGEQTLTALSLIFAVFLTNPSPICVLDEVDAPLDDANVDRFCLMMERMAADTSTRFLVITHHPMTMARMQRLFGVTMAEKGISQLVSVDLATAERFIVEHEQRAAG